MPSSGDDSETSAIEAAYQEQIHALFKVLVNNLIDEPISHQTDQQSLAKFTAGLNVAKRARQLALSAVHRRWQQPLGDYDGGKSEQNDLERRAPMAEGEGLSALHHEPDRSRAGHVDERCPNRGR